MLKRRRTRLLLIGALIVVGAGLIVLGLTRNQAEAIAGTPMDVEMTADGTIYASTAEGRILRLSVDGERIATSVLAEGLAFPRGIAIIGDTLYVAELGDLPCENPIPRCKGEHVGPTAAEGERRLMEASSGRVLAMPIQGDGLGEPRAIVDELRFVNTDHGLNDLEVGADGALYLSVGNLDRLAWDDRAEPPVVEGVDRIGSVLRIDPGSGAVSVFASGTRNVYGLAVDGEGRLWGVDNDGPGRGAWRFEELLQLEEGLDYGFPDDGTVGPYQRRTGFARWIMPVGAGSSGLLVRGDEVISGGCGRVTRVSLTSPDGDALVDEAEHRGCVTAILPLDGGRLLLATVLGETAYSVVAESALFGD